VSPDALKAELRAANQMRVDRARATVRRVEVELSAVLQSREAAEVELREALVELERWRS